MVKAQPTFDPGRCSAERSSPAATNPRETRDQAVEHLPESRKASTVATALKRLRELGILNWVRRCAESWQEGRFVLEQETNAYAVLPESQWRGYRPPEEPPAPLSGTWGDPAPLPSALAQAALEGDLAGKVHVLASDPKDRLAAALARLGRAFMACELVRFHRSARDAEKPAPELDPTCNSRLGPADRRKEDALNKKRRVELVPR